MYKMELNWTLAIWAGVCLLIGSLILGKKKGSQGRRPPGPPGWPIIGNIFDLGVDAHQSLATLSRKYGPIMWLQLGATNTLVVSSAEVAMEMFKKHDLAVSDRHIFEGFKANGYDKASMGFAPYGTFWRMMRRIYTTELFTNNRIKATEEFRTKSMDKMLEWMWKDAQEKGSVEVARFIEMMNFNAIGNAIFSKDIVDPQLNKGTELFNATSQALEITAKPNFADFFPWLRWLDPQGVKKRMKQILDCITGLTSALVKERIKDRENGKRNEKKDFLDVMLDFEGNQLDGESAKLSEHNIAVGIQELLQAATDTSTSTIEWVLTELLRNPKTMRKVEAELAQVVGQKKLQEEDIQNLHYLKAAVKESLRLHPALPLLVPRRVREHIDLMGYSIPRNTQVYVNVWAIARDPASWDNPLTFKPERFLCSDVDYKGQHFQFLPFGAGRRMCVGLPLAQNMIYRTVGTLIHKFELSLEEGTTPDKINVNEKLGLSLKKADPLKVVLKLRSIQENIIKMQ